MHHDEGNPELEVPMDTTDPFAPHTPAPTAARPLLGLTVLVVEDSRFACEAMRLLCLRSGARIRRADCLRSARRHLQVYRPSIVIIDLGLPDGDGEELITELADPEVKDSLILGTSGNLDGRARALAAGADGFLDKPITSLATFQELVLNVLPSDRQPAGPRAMSKEEIVPDRIAYQDDISHVADVLETLPDSQSLDYVAQFLAGVARSADDPGLEDAATALAQKRATGASTEKEVTALNQLIKDRLSNQLAI